jgi:hypothetical protein
MRIQSNRKLKRKSNEDAMLRVGNPLGWSPQLVRRYLETNTRIIVVKQKLIVAYTTLCNAVIHIFYFIKMTAMN